MADAQARDGVGRVGTHHHDRGGRRRHLVTLFDQRQSDAVEADAEADARRRLPAKQLDEAVVATATAERLWLTLCARPIELECRPRVVVEAAHERRCRVSLDTDGSEMLAERRQVVGAGIAEVVRDARRTPR